MASRLFAAKELQDVRTLAQKLFAQCRLENSYKLLAGSIRALRNHLEDVEELLDDTRLLGPDDLKVLDQVARSRHLLERLDFSLQSFRCSKNKDVNQSAIADFKTGLDVAGHELAAALEAITHGEIELRLDTNIAADVGVKSTSSHLQSASSSLADTHERRSSHTSSSWSLVPHDSPAKAATPSTPILHLDTGSDHDEGLDKEVYEPEPRSSISNSTMTEPRISLDWRSPFLEPDPLSISIEQASSLILGGNNNRSPKTVRPRSTTEPLLSHDLQVDDDGVAIRPSTAAGETDPDRLEQNHDSSDQERVRRRGYSDTQQRSSRKPALRVREASFSQRIRLSTSDSTVERTVINEQSEVVSASNHLSPQTAAAEFLSKRRSNSATSITFSVRSVGTGQPAHDNEFGQGYTSPPTDGIDDDQTQAKLSTESTSSAVAQSPAEIARGELLGLGLNLDVTPKVSDLDNKPEPKVLLADKAQLISASATEEESPPPPPKRRPPTPPRPRRRDKPARQPSQYRIANLSSPVSRSSDEDDLYSTSRPSSPTEATTFAQPESDQSGIPGVHVEGAVADEDRLTNSISRSNKGYGRTKRILENRANDSSIDAGSVLPRQEGEHTLAAKSSAPMLSVDRIYHDDMLPELKRHSTSIVPSKDNKTTFTESVSSLTKSPVPSRLSTARYRSKSNNERQTPRPAPSVMRTSPAAIPQEKERSFEQTGLELVAEDGLEVNDWPARKGKNKRLNNRMTIEKALGLDSPSVSARPSVRSQDEDKHVRSASLPQTDAAPKPVETHQHAGWYGPGVDDTPTTDLDEERISHIIHFFNTSAWDQAEAYLMGYLESLIEQDALARARRIRHLLGVCASYKGQLSRAIPLFLSVMRTPLDDVALIDDGDCSAAYWLGDAYSLENQRTEALLAYCVAERSSIFHDSADIALSDLISVEQEAVQLGVSKADFKLRWAQEANRSSTEAQSILATNVITTNTARMLLENEPRKARRESNNSPFKLDQNRSRSNSLFWLSKMSPIGKFYRMKLTRAHFDPDTPWPMMYDPLFCMANVQRGRVLAYECNLLSVFNSNKEAKVPRSGPMGLSRMDCFTCSDLNWLITTVRECLSTFEMEYSEVANVEGTWFVPRYTFMNNKIATTFYFAISIFKPSLRSGYGVEICPDGICSARINKTDYEHDKGVHTSESRRIRKLIREYLDEAAKQRPKIKKKDSFGVSSPTEGAAAMSPPIPPRP